MNADEIAPRLLQACPNAAKAWQEHLEWWEGEERGHYNDMAVFANHIVDSYAAGETSEFEAFFDVLEECVVDGSTSVRDLAVLGLIESIQNIASHSAAGYSVFELWLGAKSEQAWREVEAMWDGQGSLADVVRAERRGK